MTAPTNELNYRLNIWKPDGTGPRTLLRDESFIVGEGLGLPLTPEGDAGEGRIQVRNGPVPNGGPGSQIQPLDVIQVEFYKNAVWEPIYYGQVRIGGNTRNPERERIVMRSMLKRLKNVVLSEGFTTPKQAAHLTIAAIIQDVLPRVNGLILFDASLITDLGFDARAIERSNQQDALSFLERVVQDGEGMGVKVRMGVRPDRKFFCRVAKTDVLEVTDADLKGRVEWVSPVAEDVVTAVLWFISKRPDGSWLTHKSVSPAATQYGEWVKRMELQASAAEIWENVPATYQWYDWGDRGAAGYGYRIMSPQPSLDPALLQDGDLKATQSAYIPGTPVGSDGSWAIQTFRLLLTPSAAPDRIRYVGKITQHTKPNGVPVNEVWAAKLGVAAPGDPTANDRELDTTGMGTPFNDVYYVKTADFNPDGSLPLLLQPTSVAYRVEGLTVDLAEFRAERVNTTLLDDLAKYHYSVPLSDPANISLAAFIPPAGLSGRVKYGTYERDVTFWEYRVTAGRGAELAAIVGEADNPVMVALASLIKAKDQQATVDALTAQT